jgi:vancomycin resistance protein YoaR
MKKFKLIIISFFVLYNTFVLFNVNSQIVNEIVVKVGDSLITSIDIQNEIITNLVINKQEINQDNINNNKNYALKNLINKTIKKNEIKKFEIKKFNKQDLQNYISDVAKNLNTDRKNLKIIFKQAGINYDSFVENREVELLWNTLIFTLYENQTNVNIIDVDNELENIKNNKSEEELKEIRKKILDRKKSEKLDLFSRSHFSTLENSVTINFQ